MEGRPLWICDTPAGCVGGNDDLTGSSVDAVVVIDEERENDPGCGPSPHSALNMLPMTCSLPSSNYSLGGRLGLGH